jgi:hypothetical protein
MIGFPPWWAVLLLMLGVVALACLYLLHAIVLIVVLVRRRKLLRPARQQPYQWNLRSFLFVSLLSATVVGLDVRVPTRRARESAEKARRATELPRTGARAFFEAVRDGDPRKLKKARNQFLELQVEYSHTESLYLRGLEHPDPRVQLETVRLFGRFLNRNGRKTLTPKASDALLTVVRDPHADVVVRQEAVTSVLQSYEEARRPLYEALSAMGKDAVFAVPQLAEFLVDDSHRHWRPGGAFDAPIGTVHVLQELGPLASDALPQLEQALNHPNEWDFVPAVVEAIGVIGQQNALPLLEKASNSERREVRTAAEKAIQRIRSERPPTSDWPSLGREAPSRSA